MFHSAMIPRPSQFDRIRSALGRSRIVLLVGPRQCGKTTLARDLVPPESINHFDLEDPASLARLDEPMTALAPLEGLVVIDEIQRRPELFPILRVLADRQGSPAQFLILGSASGDLLRQSSESLAGRVEQLTLGGFHPNELPPESSSALWLRGGFPLSFLAATDADSAIWRNNFIQSLLERDLPQWGVRVPAVALRRCLVDAGALPRSDLERCGTGSGTRCLALDHTAIPGSADGCVHDSPATTLSREYSKAPGKGAESLCARQWPSAFAAGYSK